jgi:hypothetical protein
MEFLDPKKKRQHQIQLYIGYALMAVVISLATMIFVYQAEGYDLDRKSGEIVRNGIVFVDSSPQGASIYLNGEKRRETTDSRLVVQEGQYSLKIEKPGYKSWEKSFILGGGSIERYSYPFLFPENPTETTGGQFPAQPLLTTTSPDRNWLIINDGVAAMGFSLKIYDLSKEQPTATSVMLPASSFIGFNAAARLSVVEWSTDNRHVLLQYEVAGNRQFIIYDRANPDSIVNINGVFNVQPTKVNLYDKAVEKVFIYDTTSKDLRIADLVKKTIEPPIAQQVLEYKPHGADIVLFSALLPDNPSLAGVYIRHDEKTFLLRTVPYSETENYLLDVARFDGHWYYVVSTKSEGKIYIYKDAKAAPNGQTPSYLSVMRLDNPMFVSFSANTRNIAVQSGGTVAVYDLETNRQYKFTLNGVAVPETYKMEWMDGHRLLTVRDGSAYAIDFDGTNQLTIVGDRVSGDSVYFDRNYKTMLAFRTAPDSAQVGLSFFDLLTPDK